MASDDHGASRRLEVLVAEAPDLIAGAGARPEGTGSIEVIASPAEGSAVHDRRRNGVDAFIDRYGADAPEVIWIAALALLERAATDARASSSKRWRYYARNEVRRLRRELAAGLMLARLAAALQQEENDRETAALSEALGTADAQRRERRREGTVEANRARVRQMSDRHESMQDDR